MDQRILTHLQESADPKLSLFVTRLTDRGIPLEAIDAGPDSVAVVSPVGWKEYRMFCRLNAERCAKWYAEAVDVDFWKPTQ